MNRRDRETAAAAVGVLLRKDAGAELRRCASAALESLGIDPYSACSALAGASRAPRTGMAGPLRKDQAPASAAQITLSHESASGERWRFEMSRAEAAGLADAALSALYGRR